MTILINDEKTEWLWLEEYEGRKYGRPRPYKGQSEEELRKWGEKDWARELSLIKKHQ